MGYLSSRSVVFLSYVLHPGPQSPSELHAFLSAVQRMVESIELDEKPAFESLIGKEVSVAR